MVNVSDLNCGYLIENMLFFGKNCDGDEYLNLSMYLGEDMKYANDVDNIIDYPGEYDIEGVQIICILGRGNRLNYVIHINNKKVGLIQTDDSLSDDNVSDLDYWLIFDEKTSQMLDQMEFEGEKILLKNLEEVSVGDISQDIGGDDNGCVGGDASGDTSGDASCSVLT